MQRTQVFWSEEFDSVLFQVLTNVHRKSEVRILHRYSCNLIEQAEAHIIVGLFLHRGEKGVRW